MKTKLFLLLSVLLTITKGFAQTPQAIPYQAVARDAAGTVLTNRTLGVRFKIHDATATGIVVYSESQTIGTNSIGTFTANIGQGTVLSGSFANINWLAPKFIQVEMDINGGTAYVDMGTKQMLSVPYALNSADWVEVDYPANSNYPNGYKTLKAASKYTGFATGNSLASGAYSTAMGWSTASGEGSTAMGNTTTASGFSSTALGSYTTASGFSSTAMGYNTTASGSFSTAMGDFTTASGDYSTAMGNRDTASGNYSTAMGYLSTASGYYSTAMGTKMNTNGFMGSFMIGDSDPDYTGVTTVGGRDQFVARFRSGYYLMSSNNTTRTGVLMPSGQNSWSAISDSNRKENMLTVDGEAMLKKISRFKLSTWNYKGQDPKIFRHYGPMAQDFYNAFGHDAFGTIGCDTLINQQDFLGVSFSAIHALEKRTQKIEKLQAELDVIKTENNALREEIKSIKEMLKTKNQ